MKTVNEQTDVIAQVCVALTQSGTNVAQSILRQKLPFNRLAIKEMEPSRRRKVKIFLRDRFTDRYTGDRLIFPPVLGLLSLLMPEEFPSHTNWKMGETHEAYYFVWPAVDHVIPVARGGTNEDSNLITTSYLTNSRKAQYLPGEVGLEIIDSDNLPAWDGMLEWFMTYAKKYPELLNTRVPGCIFREWYNATVGALKDLQR